MFPWRPQPNDGAQPGAAANELMKLLPAQTDEASLLHFGREAVALFEKRDFQSLADRFGYALAFGRSPAVAIEEDFQTCIADFRASSEPRCPARPSMVVKYFRSNSSNLFAVVECFFSASEGCPILAELIVTSLGEDTHVTLEEVSLAPYDVSSAKRYPGDSSGELEVR